MFFLDDTRIQKREDADFKLNEKEIEELINLNCYPKKIKYEFT